MIIENDVRLIRQYLFALEEKERGTAEAIWDYLTKIRELNLEFKPGKRPSVILVNYAREAVYRMPLSLKNRKIGF